MEKVKLAITPSEYYRGYYLVVVYGEGFYNSVNKTVGARVRGDDPWFDDNLFSLGGSGYERVNIDGTFGLARTVHKSLLNEDWGRDEIYALVNVDGLSRTYKTNVITGHF